MLSFGSQNCGRRHCKSRAWTNYLNLTELHEGNFVSIFRHYSFLESAARLHAAVYNVRFTSEV